MDFDDDHDHDDGDEEMDLPVGHSYDTTPSLPAVPRAGPSPPQPLHKQQLVKASGAGARYRECLKNHAVNIGGHAVDGCGEFMAAGEDGTLDALRCAACNCHRNFHRKFDLSTTDIPGPAGGQIIDATPAYFAAPPVAGQHHPGQFSSYYRAPAGYVHQHHHLHPHMPSPVAAAVAQRPLPLPSTSPEADMSMPGGMMMAHYVSGGGGGSGSSSGKKRFRTKFTQEQKDKMLAFADRLGWRIQKHDEAAVQQFCEEVGIKRHVLKVWMHNNKHTLGKKPLNDT